jgi:hypothetical protein
MRDVDASEPTLLNPIPETLWLVFNRKLCAVPRDSGIMIGELKNEIIEGATEVVTNLSDQNGNPQGRGCDWGSISPNS